MDFSELCPAKFISLQKTKIDEIIEVPIHQTA